ncbi:MAG: HD domain-containing protein [Candidatus Atribacteria bacterium]|nr:MAG: HD domain-containing protein [Candidatus Atribacteria bacterium]
MKRCYGGVNMEDYFTKKNMKPILDVLHALKGIEQQVEYHPEGDALKHTYQVFKWAIRETMDLDLILAVLLHDVGKVTYSNHHTKDSVKLIEGFSSCKTVWLVKHHMRIWTYLKGEMQGLKKCLELANHCWLPDLIQLARWDAKGRNPRSQCYFTDEQIIEILNRKAREHFDKGVI